MEKIILLYNVWKCILNKNNIPSNSYIIQISPLISQHIHNFYVFLPVTETVINSFHISHPSLKMNYSAGMSFVVQMTKFLYTTDTRNLCLPNTE